MQACEQTLASNNCQLLNCFDIVENFGLEFIPLKFYPALLALTAHEQLSY